MNIFDAITRRRSHRGTFQNRAIDENELDKLIEAMRWAPSPFNVQPWELIVIQEQNGKEQLANLTETAIVSQFKDAEFLDANSRWLRVTEAEWQEHQDGILLSEHVTLPKFFQDSPEKLRLLVKNAKSLTVLGHLGAGKVPAKEIAEQVRTAPMLMLVTMNCDRQPPGEGATRWMWLSIGMLIQNLLLSATALGIGVQFISAPLENAEHRNQICQFFNIPTSHEVMTLLRLGYTHDERRESVRLEPAAFVHFEKRRVK